MRYVLAVLVGGIIVTIWGAVSWMALPFHTMSLNTLPGEGAEVEAFLSSVPEHGAYHYPGFPHHEDGTPVTREELNETMERMRRGPTASLMILHPHGKEPFAASTFVLNITVNLLGAAVLAAMIFRTRRSGGSWAAAMGVALAFAVFAVCAAVLPSWLWWGYPWLFGLLEVTDVIIAWLLGGAAMGAIIKPKRT